jgi:beta-mannosidase
MERISLNGEWSLSYFLEKEPAIDSPEALAQANVDCIPAHVPGNVELDLMREGKLPDLFLGENIYKLQPYEHYQWWYTTRFTTPVQNKDKDCMLVFHGLDCIASIWLNGSKIGVADNMLIAHAFDVSGLLRQSGENDLVVQLRSPVNAARHYRYEPSQLAFVRNFEQLYIRKAPHMYGWDITPRAVSAGIWRNVDLELHEKTEIVDTTYTTVALHGKSATLQVNWQFRTDAPLLDGFSLRFTGVCGNSRFEHVEKAYFVAGACRIDVPQAKLWWPKGYGKPNLYSVVCELLRNGIIVDSRTDVIGIRTVQLKRSEITSLNEGGEFLFRVNGEPIMCKGSNWVPLDAFHSRDAERYEPVIALFDDLGCNILRCWGGNVYEDTLFFHLCDQKGIMVWQDFAFACALYPQDRSFLDRIRAEAEAVVRKLRNHPSIVLWSGDNEIDVAYLHRGLDPANNRITREVLPQVCALCDPYRPYLPSSPYVSPEVVKHGGRDELMPEQHLWGPRDYFKSRFYTENTAHFASEIGYHGCPNVSSIKRFIEPESLWPWQDNRQWRAHTTDPVPDGGGFQYRTKLMADQIRELFGFAPDTLDEFALASQISQAEAKKYFIESFRIRKWRKTGIIWWNVIDCWPQFSDAVVDYYFVKKLAYWYIKRVQTPLCVMVDEPEQWHCRVVAGNDSLARQAGDFSIVDADSGENLLAGSFDVEPNSNRELGRIPVSRSEHRLFLISWELDGVSHGNHYLLGQPPFSFEEYKTYLRQIAALPESFDADRIAK